MGISIRCKCGETSSISFSGKVKWFEDVKFREFKTDGKFSFRPYVYLEKKSLFKKTIRGAVLIQCEKCGEAMYVEK